MSVQEVAGAPIKPDFNGHDMCKDKTWDGVDILEAWEANPLVKLDPPGLRPIKQVELFNKWRPFFPVDLQKTMCPLPSDEVLKKCSWTDAQIAKAKEEQTTPRKHPDAAREERERRMQDLESTDPRALDMNEGGGTGDGGAAETTVSDGNRTKKRKRRAATVPSAQQKAKNNKKPRRSKRGQPKDTGDEDPDETYESLPL